MKAASGFALAIIIFASTCVMVQAEIITYDVNLTFDPNSTPQSSLGAAGPGTVTGKFTVDTSIPITSSPTGNLVAVDLVENSNTSTVLSDATNSTVQVYNSVAPYLITFIGSPVTEYPARSAFGTSSLGVPLELVAFSSGPVVDSIQMGPSIQFDFPYMGGGAVLPGNFDSIASTGFDAYLYGTVVPEGTFAVPEPSSWALMIVGLGVAAWMLRWGR